MKRLKQIIHNSIVKQRNVLKHDGKQGKQCFRINFGNVHATHGDRPLTGIPKSCGQPRNSRLAAAGRPHQCRDFPLLSGKGNIFQHSFSCMVCKSHSIEDNIIAIVGQRDVTLLQRMVQDLIHTGDIGASADDRRQILQCALQRIIKPGHDEQEKKEGQHIKTAVYQQNRSCQRHCDDPQL